MIRTTYTRNQTRREMKIFSISLTAKTINEVKIWRLQDITNYICPFDRTHILRTPMQAIEHIIQCRTFSYHGVRGKQAKEIAHDWMICESDSSHLFHKFHKDMHYHLQDKCRANRDTTPLSWRKK